MISEFKKQVFPVAAISIVLALLHRWLQTNVFYAVCMIAILRYALRHRFLTGFDAIQINSDPELSTIVHGLWVLKKPVKLDEFRVAVQRLVAQQDKFRSLVIRSDLAWPYWQLDPAFDLSKHLKVARLPKDQEHSHEALEAYLSQCLATPLKTDKQPLWEMHLIERYRDGCAIIFRFHHCLADGISMLKILRTALEPVAGEPTDAVSSEQCQPASALSPSASASSSTPSSELTVSSSKADLKAAVEKNANLSPADQRNQVTKFKPSIFARIGIFLGAFFKLLVLPADPISGLRSATCLQANSARMARWMEPYLQLAEVKALAKQCGATVNDILLSALSGALRTFELNRSGPEATTLQQGNAVQAVIWVSLRPLDLEVKPGQRPDWGNQLGVVYFRLPLHIADPLQRLQFVHTQIERLKSSPEPLLASWLMSLFGFLPAIIARPLWHTLAYKVTVSMSNVPGFNHRLSFIGSEIDEFLFFVAPNRNLGNFVCIMSYAERVSFGYVSDPRLVPEPHDITRLFAAEVDSLRRAVQQS